MTHLAKRLLTVPKSLTSQSEILAYLVYLPNFKLNISSFINVLSKDEKTRMQRFYTEALQHNFALARGTLRFILAKHLNIAENAVQIDTSPLGKPSVQGAQLQFNISHTKDYCLVGLTQCDSIGVDIERFDVSDKAYYEIAKRFFTHAEYQALAESPISESKELFYHLWTQKEAFLKAIGAGLSFGLDQFKVGTQLTQSYVADIRDSLYSKRIWSSRSFSKPAGYRMTLTKENTLETLHWLDFQTIFPSRNIG